MHGKVVECYKTLALVADSGYFYENGDWTNLARLKTNEPLISQSPNPLL